MPRRAGPVGPGGDPGSERAALARISAEVVACERCPRLLAYCREVARTRVKRFRDHQYWGRPVPGFGDPSARLLVVGLAPAAHGANRTGRMFTGDRSGDWLYRALHRANFANQPHSRARDDGLRLRGVWVSAAAHCAPPDNRPTAEELRACRGYLVREMSALSQLRVILALGRIAFDAALAAHVEAGGVRPRPRPTFAHGAQWALGDGQVLLAAYHPSQQNTQTRRLTEAMLDAVVTRARALCGVAARREPGERRGRWAG